MWTPVGLTGAQLLYDGRDRDRSDKSPQSQTGISNRF
jgi:hypothetical protein